MTIEKLLLFGKNVYHENIFMIFDINYFILFYFSMRDKIDFFSKL